ncbi:MAG: phosphate ABC transporter permease PstA, partial [Thermoguttaceae bacterium]
VLGMMRAIGETIVVLMAAGNASNFPVPWYDFTQMFTGFTHAVQTMTAVIARDMGETPAGSIHRSALFAVGFVLLVFTFMLNLLTEHLASTFRKQITGQESRETILSRILRPISAFLFFVPKKVGQLIHFCFELMAAGLIRQMGQAAHLRLRFGIDAAFNVFAGLTIVFIAAVLCVVIGPILWGGSEAVVFRGTVEHRLFILQQFGRGDANKVAKEFESCFRIRKPVYEMLDNFAWLAPEERVAQAGKWDRAARENFATSQMHLMNESTSEQYQADIARFESASKKMRRTFEKMCRATEIDEVNDCASDIINTYKDLGIGSVYLTEMADSARDYARSTDDFATQTGTNDLSIRDCVTQIDETLTYGDIYRQMRSIICGSEGDGCILGPEFRGDMTNHLPPEVRYGATHWSRTLVYLNNFNNVFVYQKQFDENGNPLGNIKTKIPRVNIVSETPLSGLGKIITYTNDHIHEMLAPELTFYGFYFIDPSTAGHFLGGVGPEIFGTILITLIAVLLSLPIGVCTAAYLVEAAKDGIVTKIIRLCINTLAGVPSIVFGLFGLAIIVEIFTGKPCVLAGGITLGLLVLPIMIRASEEAIRSVPHTFKEASLGLGASPGRCFFSVTLPAALPGILTGTILAMSRAAGETAPVLFTCAVASGGLISWGENPLMQATPILSYSALDIATGDRLAKLVPYNQFGLVATLIILVLILNTTAIIVRNHISKKLRG